MSPFILRNVISCTPDDSVACTASYSLSEVFIYFGIRAGVLLDIINEDLHIQSNSLMKVLTLWSPNTDISFRERENECISWVFLIMEWEYYDSLKEI